MPARSARHGRRCGRRRAPRRAQARPARPWRRAGSESRVAAFACPQGAVAPAAINAGRRRRRRTRNAPSTTAATATRIGTSAIFTNSRIFQPLDVLPQRAPARARNCWRVADHVGAEFARPPWPARRESRVGAALPPSPPVRLAQFPLGLLQLLLQCLLLGGVAVVGGALDLARPPRTAGPRCRGCADPIERPRRRPAPRPHWRRNRRYSRTGTMTGGRRIPATAPRTGRRACRYRRRRRH